MTTFASLIGNKILISAALGWLIAQVLKIFIHLVVHREFVLERLIGNGGMPSSHSATVCSLATAAAIQYGIGSFEFALTFILAAIVMNDAMGVRLETGKQAIILNDMMEMFKEMGRWDSIKPSERLKEFVGHTPIQILVGAILGICIALAYNL